MVVTHSDLQEGSPDARDISVYELCWVRNASTTWNNCALTVYSVNDYAINYARITPISVVHFWKLYEIANSLLSSVIQNFGRNTAWICGILKCKMQYQSEERSAISKLNRLHRCRRFAQREAHCPFQFWVKYVLQKELSLRSL